jgi:hypothetical protein
MKYRDDMHVIRRAVGEMQGGFPNIECSAFVLAKEPGDIDGSLSRQGIFFSFRSGCPEPGDFEMIQTILKRHNVPPPMDTFALCRMNITTGFELPESNKKELYAQEEHPSIN